MNTLRLVVVLILTIGTVAIAGTLKENPNHAAVLPEVWNEGDGFGAMLKVDPFKAYRNIKYIFFDEVYETNYVREFVEWPYHNVPRPEDTPEEGWVLAQDVVVTDQPNIREVVREELRMLSAGEKLKNQLEEHKNRHGGKWVSGGLGAATGYLANELTEDEDSDRNIRVTAEGEANSIQVAVEPRGDAAKSDDENRSGSSDDGAESL